MNTINHTSRRRRAFTIVELLTIMSIIVILISILVPALTKVKRFATKVNQKAQFHSIDVALELFSNEFDGLPPSGARDGDSDEDGRDYCGAMKLAEALMGQDLLGFNPDSQFKYVDEDGREPDSGDYIYPEYDQPNPSAYQENVDSRLAGGPLLPIDQANARRMGHYYGNNINMAGEDVTHLFVLADEYSRFRAQSAIMNDPIAGKKIGMPVLYYRADATGKNHYTTPDARIQGLTNTGELPTRSDKKGNFYDYWDNQELIALGIPGNTGFKHPMDAESGKTLDDEDTDVGENFYDRIFNRNMTTAYRSYRHDSYLLVSAGFDGEYGSADDVYNFSE